MAGNVLTETDPRGNTTTHEYDALNRLIRSTDPAPFGFTTALTYDLAGNKRTETDRRGLTTSFGYDALNRLITTQDPSPLSFTRQFTHDAQSNALTETDRNGVLTEHTYDRENRPLETKRAGLAIERNEYDAAGNRRFVTDALGNVTGYEYDERNLLLAENLPLAAITRYTLDDMGDRRQETDPEGRVTTRTFDHRHRAITETNAAGETTAYAYDGNGNRTRKTLPKSNLWTYTVDGANRLTTVLDPVDGETRYTYDGNDNRLTQRDGNGHTTSFAYDVLNRLAQKTYPDGATIVYAYDANGNQISRTDPKNQTITRTYDELERETLATFPLPSEPTGTDLETISNEYDPNGNVLRVIEAYRGNAPPRQTLIAYDTFDRPTSITNGDGEQIRYTYDANGNRIQLTDPDGKTTQYTFDALNRTSSVTITGAGVTNYSYFKDSRLRKVTYPNGTTATHVYDPAGRTSLIENKQGPATISSFAYTYDTNGNRIQQIETNGGPSETTTYAYDLADRLAGVAYPEKAVAYTYDPVGNRLSERTTDTGGTPTSDKTYAYTNRDWLLSVTDSVDPSQSATYSYDANGNQIEKHQGGDTFRFLFDARDQLVETQKNGALVERYAFDYQGLRIKKAGSGAVVRYVYDDTSVLLQTDDAGLTIAKYEWGPDRLLSIDHATEGRSFHLFDALGSVVNLAKPDGTLQASYVYDAWGVLRRETGNSANPFLFTGYEFDRESGLYYAKARFYDPALGRFLSEDPFGGVADTPPSLHRYLYAHARPTYYTDPLGMCVGNLRCPEWLQKAKDEAGDAIEGVWNWLTEPAVSAAESGGSALDAGAGAIAAINEGLSAERYSSDEVEDYIERYQSGTASAPALEKAALGGKRLGSAVGHATDAAIQGYTAVERAQIAAGTGVIVWEGGKFVVGQVVKGQAARAASAAARFEAGAVVEAVDGSIDFVPAQVTSRVPATPFVAKRSAPPTEATIPTGAGRYSEVRGHHVHAKAGFRGHTTYDPRRGFSISQDFMESRNWSHQDMTSTQQRLFRELGASGRPNTLTEHTRIAVEALKAGGATDAEARTLVAQSLRDLRSQGARSPTRIPWFDKDQ